MSAPGKIFGKNFPSNPVALLLREPTDFPNCCISSYILISMPSLNVLHSVLSTCNPMHTVRPRTPLRKSDSDFVSVVLISLRQPSGQLATIYGKK